MSGRCWSLTTQNLWLGISIVAMFLLIGVGAAVVSRSIRSFVLSSSACIGLRGVFYWWFDPANSEWHVASLTIGVFVAVAAVRKRARPRWPSTMLSAILLIGAAASFGVHGPSTLALRDTASVDLTTQASAAAGDDGEIFVFGQTMSVACALRGVRFTRLPDDVGLAIEGLRRVKSLHPARRIVVIADRIVMDGAPAVTWLREDGLAGLDRLSARPGCGLLASRGHVAGLVID